VDRSFAERREVTFAGRNPTPWRRGRARPHLVDWDRDGHTDLVVGYPASWALQVGLGPLGQKSEVAFRPTSLAPIPGTHPVHYWIGDWKHVDRGIPWPVASQLWLYRRTPDGRPGAP
jgi:hypothetical protein